MALEIRDWPETALPFRAHALNLAVRSISGGSSLAGVERIRLPDAGLWTFRMEIRIATQPQIRLARALAALSQGRAGVWRVCIGDCGRGPGAMPGWSLPPSDVPHSDDAPFSDGAPYRGEIAGARLGAAAAVRATTIMVQMDAAVFVPEPGQHLTLDDGLHRIAAAEPQGAGLHRLTIAPPLRRASAAGARVILDRPTGLFRLAKDDALDFSLDLQKFGSLSVDMIEQVLR
jgi:hypothetical protein